MMGWRKGWSGRDEIFLIQPWRTTSMMVRVSGGGGGEFFDLSEEQVGVQMWRLKWVLGAAVKLIRGFRQRRSTGPGRGPPRAGQSGWQRGRGVVFTCSRYFLWELIRLWEGKCSVPGECRGPQNDTLTPSISGPTSNSQTGNHFASHLTCLFKILLDRQRYSYCFML